MTHIDQPAIEHTETPCPNCGDGLDYYPRQSGPCHSDLFTAHMDAEYWCQTCEEGFDPEQIETGEPALSSAQSEN